MPYAFLDKSVEPWLIQVSTAWNEKELIEQVPGARYRGAWRVPLTWAAAAQLRGVFGDRLGFDEELVKVLWEIRSRRVDPANELREALEWPAQTATQERLYPFQRAGVEFMRTARSGLLGDEMGCGKTIQLLGLLQSQLEAGEQPLPAIIICPNSIKHHWAARLNEWVPSATVYLIDGPAKKRRELIVKAKTDPTAVIIINIESVRSFSKLAPYGSIRLKRCQQCDRAAGDATIKPSACEAHPKELNNFGFRTVIVDEAHRIKDPHAKQTRAIWAICHDPSVVTRWALTGTPIANHIGDLYGIMHAVAHDEYPTKTKFIDRYALTSWNAFGGMDIVGLKPSTQDEFRKFFDPRFRRVQKAVVLPQLPPKLRTTRYVELSLGQRKMYHELEKTLMARTPDGQLLIAKDNLVAQTRLSQLAVASVTIESMENPDDPATWQVKLREPSPKIDCLVEILEELGDQQAVVVADHSQPIDLASARLTKESIPNLIITGKIAPIDRDRALRTFQEGGIRVLLFTAKAGGVGLDMSCASNLIFLQHPWSLVDYKQAEDRIHRIGSERHESVNIIDIISRDTCEEDKMRRLSEKLMRLNELTQDRAARVRAGVSTADLDAEEERLMHVYLGVPS